MDLLLLAAGAFAAGLIDAVVGGGGLVQIPLLFALYPAAAPAAIFGTNKTASVFGTGLAAFSYMRRIRLPRRETLYAAGTALVGGYLGALSVAAFPKEALRPTVLFLLLAVTVYTYRRPDFGLVAKPWAAIPKAPWIPVMIGASVGFYDGFFGPGTGSFLIFLFVRAFGWEFLLAAAAAKLVNAGTNVAALAYFLPTGQVMWKIGLWMALFNMAGAWTGARIALHGGSRVVRRLFLGVAMVLVGRFAWEIFF